MYGYRDYYAARVREEQREATEIEALMTRAMDERDCLTETEALRLAIHMLGETAAAGTAPYRGLRRAYFHGAAVKTVKDLKVEDLKHQVPPVDENYPLKGQVPPLEEAAE